MELLNKEVNCPYCGEVIELLIDDSVCDQDYYEDCSVCCRPIHIQQHIDIHGECHVVLLREDD